MPFHWLIDMRWCSKVQSKHSVQRVSLQTMFYDTFVHTAIIYFHRTNLTTGIHLFHCVGLGVQNSLRLYTCECWMPTYTYFDGIHNTNTCVESNSRTNPPNVHIQVLWTLIDKISWACGRIHFVNCFMVVVGQYKFLCQCYHRSGAVSNSIEAQSLLAWYLAFLGLLVDAYTYCHCLIALWW